MINVCVVKCQVNDSKNYDFSPYRLKKKSFQVKINKSSHKNHKNYSKLVFKKE